MLHRHLAHTSLKCCNNTIVRAQLGGYVPSGTSLTQPARSHLAPILLPTARSISMVPRLLNCHSKSHSTTNSSPLHFRQLPSPSSHAPIPSVFARHYTNIITTLSSRRFGAEFRSFHQSLKPPQNSSIHRLISRRFASQTTPPALQPTNLSQNNANISKAAVLWAKMEQIAPTPTRFLAILVKPLITVLRYPIRLLLRVGKFAWFIFKYIMAFALMYYSYNSLQQPTTRDVWTFILNMRASPEIMRYYGDLNASVDYITIDLGKNPTRRPDSELSLPPFQIPTQYLPHDDDTFEELEEKKKIILKLQTDYQAIATAMEESPQKRNIILKYFNKSLNRSLRHKKRHMSYFDANKMNLPQIAEESYASCHNIDELQLKNNELRKIIMKDCFAVRLDLHDLNMLFKRNEEAIESILKKLNTRYDKKQQPLKWHKDYNISQKVKLPLEIEQSLMDLKQRTTNCYHQYKSLEQEKEAAGIQVLQNPDDDVALNLFTTLTSKVTAYAKALKDVAKVEAETEVELIQHFERPMIHMTDLDFLQKLLKDTRNVQSQVSRSLFLYKIAISALELFNCRELDGDENEQNLIRLSLQVPAFFSFLQDTRDITEGILFSWTTTCENLEFFNQALDLLDEKQTLQSNQNINDPSKSQLSTNDKIYKRGSIIVPHDSFSHSRTLEDCIDFAMLSSGLDQFPQMIKKASFIQSQRQKMFELQEQQHALRNVRIMAQWKLEQKLTAGYELLNKVSGVESDWAQTFKNNAKLDEEKRKQLEMKDKSLDIHTDTTLLNKQGELDPQRNFSVPLDEKTFSIGSSGLLTRSEVEAVDLISRIEEYAATSIALNHNPRDVKIDFSKYDKQPLDINDPMNYIRHPESGGYLVDQRSTNIVTPVGKNPTHAIYSSIMQNPVSERVGLPPESQLHVNIYNDTLLEQLKQQTMQREKHNESLLSKASEIETSFSRRLALKQKEVSMKQEEAELADIMQQIPYVNESKWVVFPMLCGIYRSRERIPMRATKWNDQQLDYNNDPRITPKSREERVKAMKEATILRKRHEIKHKIKRIEEKTKRRLAQLFATDGMTQKPKKYNTYDEMIKTEFKLQSVPKPSDFLDKPEIMGIPSINVDVRKLIDKNIESDSELIELIETDPYQHTSLSSIDPVLAQLVRYQAAKLEFNQSRHNKKDIASFEQQLNEIQATLEHTGKAIVKTLIKRSREEIKEITEKRRALLDPLLSQTDEELTPAQRKQKLLKREEMRRVVENRRPKLRIHRLLKNEDYSDDELEELYYDVILNLDDIDEKFSPSVDAIESSYFPKSSSEDVDPLANISDDVRYSFGGGRSPTLGGDTKLFGQVGALLESFEHDPVTGQIIAHTEEEILKKMSPSKMVTQKLEKFDLINRERVARGEPSLTGDVAVELLQQILSPREFAMLETAAEKYMESNQLDLDQNTGQFIHKGSGSPVGHVQSVNLSGKSLKPPNSILTQALEDELALQAPKSALERFAENANKPFTVLPDGREIFPATASPLHSYTIKQPEINANEAALLKSTTPHAQAVLAHLDAQGARDIALMTATVAYDEIAKTRHEVDELAAEVEEEAKNTRRRRRRRKSTKVKEAEERERKEDERIDTIIHNQKQIFEDLQDILVDDPVYDKEHQEFIDWGKKNMVPVRPEKKKKDE